ncbi:MAG TPA: hypothetical protein V6C91_05510 [Coleofasciculaceae cyanobacterium]
MKTLIYSYGCIQFWLNSGNILSEVVFQHYAVTAKTSQACPKLIHTATANALSIRKLRKGAIAQRQISPDHPYLFVVQLSF